MNPLHSPWTETDDTILRQTYPAHGWKACCPLLPHRTKAAITTRVQELGIKRVGVKTGLEKSGVTEQWVVDKYRELKSKGAVAKLLRMSPQAILDILRKHGAEHLSHGVLEDRREEVITAYMDPNLSLDEVAASLGVSWPTARASLKRWGVEPPPHRATTHMSLSGGRSKLAKDERYFDVIDTPEKAYWLGLIYADGYNGESPTWVFTIGLQRRDRELVEKLSIRLYGVARLKEVAANSHEWNGLTIKSDGAYRVVVSSRHMSEALSRVGVTRAKSQTLQFPSPDQVPQHLLSSFMLGYFDGDGCISSHDRPPYNRRYAFSLISTEQFCKQYQRVLAEQLGVAARTHKQLKMTILTVSGNEQIEKTLRWLYENSPVWLSLKRAVYDELCAYNVTNPKRPTSSKYRGITFDKSRKTTPWLARVRIDGKVKTIASAETEEEAHQMRQAYLTSIETVPTLGAEQVQ